jgi:hypothetical protein
MPTDPLVNMYGVIYAQIRRSALSLGIPVAPGASEEQLAALRRHLGRPIPPSYADLLRLRDGVPDVGSGLCVLGTHDMLGDGPFSATLADWSLEFWEDAGVDWGDSTARHDFADTLPDFSPWLDLVIGIDPVAQRVAAFDSRDVSDPLAEPPVIVCDRDGGNPTRYPAFVDWLMAGIYRRLNATSARSTGIFRLPTT